jgi:MYXO-CTERM domain-containing protein
VVNAITVLALLMHLPHASGGDAHGTPETAFEIEDVDKSIVLYDAVECGAEQLWMRFDASQSENLFLQLGVPEIERLRDYRPSIAVLAEGLPAVDVPFDLPAGYGGVVFSTEGQPADSMFFEPFTGTSSWVHVEEWLALPDQGIGYIVAWTPSGMTGKQWVAVGTVEDFSGGIPVPLEDVQAFHEIGDFTPETEPVEETCEDPGAGDDDGHQHDTDGHHHHDDDGDHGTEGEGDAALAMSEGGGCSIGGRGGSEPLFILGIAGLFGIRRRKQY